MKAKITDRLVKSLKPSHKPYEVVDTEVAGFMMRVQPLGTMIDYVLYRLHDRRRLSSNFLRRSWAKSILCCSRNGARKRIKAGRNDR